LPIYPAFELWHLRRLYSLRFLETRQRAEEEAQRVPEPPVAVGGTLQDLGPDAQVGGIVRLRHPEAEDVGAVLFDDIGRGDDIALGFRHLAALLVEREAMRQDRVVGCAAHGAAGLQHRGLEPAAMLVGAFEIEARGAHPVRAVAE